MPYRRVSMLFTLMAAALLAGCPDSTPTAPAPPGGAEVSPAEDATPAGDENAAPEEAGSSETPAPPPQAEPATETSAASDSAATPPAANEASTTSAEARPLPAIPDPYAVPFTPSLSPAQAAEGWISLFDGQSLMGWRRHDDGADWQVADGVITASDGPVDLLCTSVPFANYELKLDFRMEAGGNSGVFLRTDARPGKVDVDCFELNIADSQPQGYTTGAFVGRKATEQPIPGSGGWKTFHVTAQGNRFTVYLDGDLVLEYTDESPTYRQSGLIGLQKNAGKIEFRNIHLKPLGLAPLFNGQDLTGWRAVPGGASEFSVADGTIQVVNGRGFLETEGEWADFVFQAESRTNAPGLNSGYFFRGPKIADGGNCNGYEAQIENNIIDGDRKQPKDFGTGAIYRRVKARYVVPNDEEWFTSTVIASGPRISTWVNGYQVVDWVDTRPAAETARAGLFTGAGHISLQGHDPTTTLAFRNLRIAPVTAR